MSAADESWDYLKVKTLGTITRSRRRSTPMSSPPGGDGRWFCRAREPPSWRADDEEMKLHEGYISKVQLFAGCMWATTLLLLAATAVLWMVGAIDLGALILLTTGVLLTGMAGAVAQVKGYAIRVASLVRLTAGLDDEGGSLRAVR